MSSDGSRDRPISAQKLPVSLAGPRPRAFPDAVRPAAAFLAHILSGRPNMATPKSATADRLYRQAEKSDIKRMPPGFRKNLSA